MGHIVGFAADPLGFATDLLTNHGVENAVGLGVVGMDELCAPTHSDHLEWAFVIDHDLIVKGGEFETVFSDAIIAAEGDKWWRQRDGLDPLSRWGRVDDYVSAMRRWAERRLRTWPDAGALSFRPEMEAVTLDIVFTTIFGWELDRNGDERIRSAADGFNGRFAPASWVLPSWAPAPNRCWFDRADRALREEIREPIETTDDESLTRHLADALGTGTDCPTTVESLESQFVGMVFAGHETAALVFTHMLHLLATHPEIHERVITEVDYVVGDDPVTVEAARELPVLERVIKETVRLHSPVRTFPRETTKPFPTSDRVIPAGTDIHPSIVRTRRGERWYDDPLAPRSE